MKVVIDTNVLVSAALKDRGPERVIRWVVSHEDWHWMVADEILAEYREVLARPKFGLDSATLADWLHLLASATEPVETGPAIAFARDPADAVFLSCALACHADYLITGDNDFTVARRLGNTVIISVSLFERIVCAAF